MNKPTDRQLEIHAWMLAYQAQHGMPPTTREIQDAFKFKSTNSVKSHLVLLAKKGLVTHRPKCARGYLALQSKTAEAA
jgi:repressor LexA